MVTVALEVAVAGAVDFVHAADANGREDFVVAEAVALGEARGVNAVLS